MFDTSLDVWQDRADDPTYEREVYGGLIGLLRNLGWSIGLDPKVEKHYPSISPSHRRGSRGKKTRRKRKSVFIPPGGGRRADARPVGKGAHGDDVGRSKRPIPRHREDLYLYSPRAAAYNPSSLRARWGRWLACEEGTVLCQRWRTWLEEMRRRYEWELDPEDARGPTIHGLRGTGILARFALRYDTAQIANDVDASRQTIEHAVPGPDGRGRRRPAAPPAGQKGLDRGAPRAL
jgi:hypothetical protein